MQKTKPKVIVIVGPTTVGKSELAIRLAKKFSGEIISADSRQVYRGLDIGSGKVTKKERRGVPHHLLDVANPKRIFTVACYQTLAEKAIQQINRRGKVPIIVGGTGFYIQAIVDNLVLPKVKPNQKLRRQLAQKTTNKLYHLLLKIDPVRAGNIDAKNPRRLIRAIEIAKTLGQAPKIIKSDSPYDFLIIGLDLPINKLKEKIKTRLRRRLKAGLIQEVKNLRRQGLSWQRLDSLGLEYRFVAKYLKNELTKKAMIEILAKEIGRYVKRQRIWFKKDKRIKWLDDKDQVVKIVKKFFSKKLPEK